MDREQLRYTLMAGVAGAALTAAAFLACRPWLGPAEPLPPALPSSPPDASRQTSLPQQKARSRSNSSDNDNDRRKKRLADLRRTPSRLNAAMREAGRSLRAAARRYGRMLASGANLHRGKRPHQPPAPKQSVVPGSASEVLSLVRKEFPPWRDNELLCGLDESAFLIKPLTGGSSNTLWLLQVNEEEGQAPEHLSSLPPSLPTSLVIRFYGTASSSYIDREMETRVADLLSAAGIGAKIYHHLAEPHAGRIEQFIPGRTLKHNELVREEMAKPIARELARLHTIPLDDPATVGHASSISELCHTPVLFDNMWKWFTVAITARAQFVDGPSDPNSAEARADPFSLAAQNALAASLGMPDLKQLLADGWDEKKMAQVNLRTAKLNQLPAAIRDNKWFKELRWLEALLANWNSLQLHPSQPKRPKPSHKHIKFLEECIVFSHPGLCHNDVNPGNIIYYEGGTELLSPEPLASPSSATSSSSTFSSSSSTSDASSPDPTVPLAFTLIDFEYAAFNYPSFDLANHLCERGLDYTGPSWPFFQSKHHHFFPRQEHMMTFMDNYAQEKSRFMSSSPRVTSHALSHLYVSTFTSMMASHLLWCFWSVIQSATSAHSSAAHPSWERQPDGQPFQMPPLGYLEYAEQRFELYDVMKRAWLQHNYAEPGSEYGPPPPWQAMDAPSDWALWLEQLEQMHFDVRKAQLKSEQRQQKALREYIKGYKDRGQQLPWSSDH